MQSRGTWGMATVTCVLGAQTKSARARFGIIPH
jgi:hypothetical protein